MEHQENTGHFKQNRAIGYDARQAKVAPMMQSLYRCMNAVLAPAPQDAHVLCVGVGTGAELLSMASAFPEWTFTALDPEADMLEICQQHAHDEGILERCTFHEGYLDTLPDTTLFDIATCIQVSYFMLDLETRISFYADIASRLKQEGFLVNADFSADMADPGFEVLRDAWVALHHQVELFIKPEYLGRDVAVLSHDEIVAMLAASGFSESVMFYQNLLMCAWCSRKKQ